MRGGRQKQGYTIVEVMIFLAISGIMFIVAAGFINGKQAKAEFKQGMNDINSQVQQAINDVSNGFYPSRGGFNCIAGDTGIPTFPSGSNTQGTNKGCTFIGKVFQFGITGSPANAYNIYSIIGRQFKPSADASVTFTPPASFADALPVAATGSGNQNLTQPKTLQWGLQLDKLTSNGTNIGAFGFFSGFATSNADNKLESGAAAPIAVAIPGSTQNQTTPQLEQEIKDLASATINTSSNSNIVMCFRGSGNQFGRLNIGSSDNAQGQKLATHIQITTGSPSGACV